MNPVYGYQAVNVEAQKHDLSSLLRWTRRMLHVRAEHAAFGLGDYVTLDTNNPSVLAFLRHHSGAGAESDDTVLCVFNLSRHPQPAELDLHDDYAEHELFELTGGVRFVPIGRSDYSVTLSGYGFFWFSVLPPVVRP